MIRNISEVKGLFKEKNYSGALKKCSEILSSDPFCSQARFFRALCYYYQETHDYNMALKDFEKIEDGDFDYDEARFNMGLIYLKQQQFAEAENIFTELYEKTESPECNECDYESLWLRGCSRYGQPTREKMKKALEDFKKVLRKHDESVVHIKVAEAHYVLKNYDEVFTSCKKALKINKNCHLAHFGTGCVHLEKKKFKDALVSFEKAVELSCNNKYYCYRAGYVSEKLKNFKKADSYYEKCVEHYEKEPDVDSFFYKFSMNPEKRRKAIKNNKLIRVTGMIVAISVVAMALLSFL